MFLPGRLVLSASLLTSCVAGAGPGPLTSTASEQGTPQLLSPAHPVSVKALDLTRAPTEDELIAAGQLGGPLFPTHELTDKPRQEAAPWAFGKAINEWNKHEYPRAVAMFREHVREFPDSPWAGEALLHVGCDATYNGRYSEAEAIFKELMARHQGSQHPGARMLLNKARQRLALVKVEQNNLAEANDLFRDLKRESPDWKQRTYAIHWLQRLSRLKGAKEALANCGAEALACVLEGQGDPAAARAVSKELPQSLRGHSIRSLIEMAATQGRSMVALQITTNALAQVPLPAILYVSRRGAGDQGHYWVLDKVLGDGVELFDPQSRRRFHQNLHQLALQWSGKILALANGQPLPGRKLEEAEMEEALGGCCGAPLPPDNLGPPRCNDGPSGNNPEQNNNGPSGPNPEGPAAHKSCGTGAGSSSCGAPRWSVNLINLNLYVKDTPLWHDSPVGPPVAISLSYNSQSAIANYEPFGNKWQFNYGGYLIMDTAGTVTLFTPNGRHDMYVPTPAFLLLTNSNFRAVSNSLSTFTPPYQVHNTLTEISSNHFELRLPMGTVCVYQVPPGTTSQQPFLTSIRDVYGQALNFGYGSNVNLTTVTDAQSNVFTLSYNAAGLVTNVADPFGRQARFEYDTNRNLVKITDMGGYWSAFTYDTNMSLTSISDSRGTTYFATEPADGIGKYPDAYPPPGGPMFANYRITVTNPQGAQEEYFYYGGCDIDGYGECSGYSWYVSPRDYLPWQSLSINNYMSRVPKTRFLPVHMDDGQHSEFGMILYPEGNSVLNGYDTATGDRTSISDGNGNTWNYTYNSMGRITSVTDAKGGTTTFAYATNDLDIISVSNGLGSVSITYNSQHDPTLVIDRLGNRTAIAYNAYGQMTSRTDALGITNLYLYDAGQRLSQILRDGSSIQAFSYDALGRVRTNTDATGLSRVYDYSPLNQVIRITYPDGRFTSYLYSDCCPRLLDTITDRWGRTASFSYDLMKRLIATINPEGAVTQFAYDANGNLSAQSDPNGATTTYSYDLNNRLSRQAYPDGNGRVFVYDQAGLRAQRADARGIVTTYGYDANHNLLTVSYSEGTPGVTNVYDQFNRLVQVIDAAGTSTYAYDANSRITTVLGPWSNTGTSYTYDPIGHVTNIAVQGSQPVNHIYDHLNRLAAISVGGLSWTYQYPGASPLVSAMIEPSGSFTAYQSDNLNRLTDLARMRSNGSMSYEYSYTYGDQDLCATETVSNGLAIAFRANALVRYQYDGRLNELLALDGGGAFAYDPEGNLVRGYTPSGALFSATYDAANRMRSLVYTNAGGVACSNQYTYYDIGLVAETREYTNGILSRDTRFVRVGYLTVQERGADNSVGRAYVWGLHQGGGIGGLLGMLQSGAAYTYSYDGRGNVIAVQDSSQNVVAAYSYDSFGVLAASSGTFEQPFGFSTKPYDAQSGLSDFGFRYFAPGLGRWLSRDPLGGSLGNLYAFADNDPINRLDAFGLASGYIGGEAEVGAGPDVSVTFGLPLENGFPKGFRVCIGLGVGIGEATTIGEAQVESGDLEPGLRTSIGVKASAQAAAGIGGKVEAGSGLSAAFGEPPCPEESVAAGLVLGQGAAVSAKVEGCVQYVFPY